MIYAVAWYSLMSLITFIVYGVDKRRAGHGEWRIKERTLHLLELLGGWPGAFAAQRFFHHKSKKTHFQMVFWFIVLLHLLGWGLLMYHRR